GCEPCPGPDRYLAWDHFNKPLTRAVRGRNTTAARTTHQGPIVRLAMATCHDLTRWHPPESAPLACAKGFGPAGKCAPSAPCPRRSGSACVMRSQVSRWSSLASLDTRAQGNRQLYAERAILAAFSCTEPVRTASGA